MRAVEGRGSDPLMAITVSRNTSYQMVPFISYMLDQLILKTKSNAIINRHSIAKQ